MKKIMLVQIILGFFCCANGWEDPYDQFWIMVSPDSSFIWGDGGYMKISSGDVFAKTEYIDSLYRLRKWPRCVFNFHIGKCNQGVESKYREFLELNSIRTGAIGCRYSSAIMKVTILWKSERMPINSDTEFVFSEVEFRRAFSDVNLDTNHFEQYKSRLIENKRKNEEWENSIEGKEYRDSLDQIVEKCSKNSNGSTMGCVENIMFEFGKRWKARKKPDEAKNR